MTGRNLCTTTAQQMQDQDQGKPKQNHMETLYSIIGTSWNIIGTHDTSWELHGTSWELQT